MVVVNQPDIVVVKKKAVVIDVASDSKIRMKEHEKIEKYQGLEEEPEKMCGVKASVVPAVIGERLQITPVRRSQMLYLEFFCAI